MPAFFFYGYIGRIPDFNSRVSFDRGLGINYVCILQSLTQLKEKLYNPAGENDVTLKDGRRKNWFWDYNSVFKSSLSAHAKLVRLYLSQCANRDRLAWPSLKTIADACGISRATAKRAVSELVEEGWLKKILRRKESGEYLKLLCTLRPAGRVK